MKSENKLLMGFPSFLRTVHQKRESGGVNGMNT